MQDIDINLLNEAQKNGAYPVELVSIQIDEDGGASTLGVNEIQSATYTGTRSNVVATNPGTNEFARISIPSVSTSQLTPYDTSDTDVTYTVTIDTTGIYPFEIGVDGLNVYAVNSDSTTWPANGGAADITSIDELVTYINSTTFSSDIANDAVNLGNNILQFTFVPTGAARRFPLEDLLDEGELRLFDGFIGSGGTQIGGTFTVTPVQGLIRYGYDPDTSDTVYTTSVPNNTLVTGAADASALLTTMGNTIADLETDITFDGVVGNSTRAATITANVSLSANDFFRIDGYRDAGDGYLLDGNALTSEQAFSLFSDGAASFTINGTTYSYTSITNNVGGLTGSIIFEGVTPPITPTDVPEHDDTPIDFEINLNHIDIDLGTSTNIGQMLTATDLISFDLTETHGVPGVGSTGTATTYTLNHYNGSEITQFTSSVTSNTESDLDSVKTSILSGINNSNESPVDFTATDDTANSKIIATAGTQNTVNGMFSLSVNNHGQSTDAGDINFNGSSNFTGTNTNFIVDTQGVFPVIGGNNLYLNTGYNNITYNGNTYVAGAGVLSLSPVEETLDIKTNSINIELSGLPIDHNGVKTTLINLFEGVEGEATIRAVGSIVTIYQSFIDAATGQPVTKVDNSPAIYQKWQGIIYSFATTEENQGENQVKLTAECKNILVALLDSKSGRFTSDTSFKQINSTDRSMEYVASTINFNPQFGSEE